jgi:ketosteroid isomerase-like protein
MKMVSIPSLVGEYKRPTGGLGMEDFQRLLIESKCVRLMTEFSWRVDAKDYDGVLKLFTQDCIFGRTDLQYNGHIGLRKALDARSADRVTRHALSNIVIDVLDPDNARGKAYCVAFGHRGALSASGEAPLNGPDSIIVYTTEFARQPHGWLISNWHIGLSFRKSPTL